MSPDDAPADAPPSDEGSDEERASIRAQRLAKLARLRDEGVDPYPYRFDRDRTIGELRDAFGRAGGGGGDRHRRAGRRAAHAQA